MKRISGEALQGMCGGVAGQGSEVTVGGALYTTARRGCNDTIRLSSGLQGVVTATITVLT